MALYNIDETRNLFDELVPATRTLLTTCNLAATVLSEDFQNMITGPASAVKAILDRCPQGGIAWDGSWNESDIEASPWNSGYDSNTGLLLTHKHTGKSVQMHYPVNSNAEKIVEVKNNAMSALKSIVNRYVENQRRIGSM
jgi:hypothetical protein